MEWIRRQIDTVLFLREGRNYFYFLRIFQLIAGYPVSLRTVPARIVMAIRVGAFSLYLLSLLHKLTYTLHQPEDANYMAAVSGSCGMFIASLIMLSESTSHYEYFRKLEDFFNDRTFARNHPLTRRIRERCYRWGNCFTLAPQVIAFVIVLQCFFEKQYDKNIMILVIQGEPVGTPFTHSLYICFFYFPSLCFFMRCSMVNVCLVGFLAEMEILASRLGELDDTVKWRLQDEGNESCRKSFWNAYHDELRQCATRHCEIFRMIAHMQQFSSLLFLLQHSFSLTILVASSYLVLRANALQENITFVEYPIPLVFLYFIFCLLVEKVQNMNNLIGERLYGTEWMLQLRYSREFHHEYQSAVRTIAILLGRSQQRIRFTCGSINEVSMAKFTEFLNIIYTVVMFFININ